MPSLSRILRPDLGLLAYQYLLENEDYNFFAGFKVLPLFSTPERSGTYGVMPISAFLTITDTLRAPGANYAQDDYESEVGSYATVEHGIEQKIDDTKKASYRHLYDLDVIATQRAVDKMRRAHESRSAAITMNPSLAGGTGAVTTSWKNVSTCNPKADIRDAISTMRHTSGLRPKYAIMTQEIFDLVVDCDHIAGRLQYTAPLEIAPMKIKLQAVAAYLGVSEVLVPDALVNTSKKKNTAVLQDIWSSSYVALLTPPSNLRDLESPCFGRTFLWTEDSLGFGENSVPIEKYRNESIRSDVIRARAHLSEGCVTKGGLFLVSGINT